MGDEEKLGFKPSQELPTTQEIAAEGVRVFRSLVTDPHIPPVLREILINLDERVPRNKRKTKDWADARAVFTGVTPESNDNDLIKYLSSEELVWFENFLKNTDFGIIDGSFVNFKAAARLMHLHTNKFPSEALKDPKNWLINHSAEWQVWKERENQDVEDRFGLLSGFPFTAVNGWAVTDRIIREKITYVNEKGEEDFGYQRYFQNLSREENLFLNSLAEKEIERTNENLQVARNLYKKARPTATPKQIDLLVNKRGVRSEIIPGFGYLGFSDADEEYMRELEKIHLESGIEDVAAEVREAVKLGILYFGV